MSFSSKNLEGLVCAENSTQARNYCDKPGFPNLGSMAGSNIIPRSISSVQGTLVQKLKVHNPSTTMASITTRKRSCNDIKANNDIYSKKLRQPSSKDNLPTLPMDIFGNILTYLEPHAMLSLASTCRETLRIVTHKLVIRNSIMQGSDHARINVQGLLVHLQRKFIYMPSPMRMLRIVNGTSCESKDCQNKVSSLTTGALLFCESCQDAKMMKYAGKLKRNKEYGPILLNEKIMGSFWSLPFVNKRPYRSSDRERNGTIITKTAIERMVREDITVDEYFDDYLQDLEFPNERYVEELIDIADQAEHERTYRIEEIQSRKPDTVIEIEEALSKIKDNLNGCAKDFAMDYNACKPHWRICITYPLTRSLLGRITCHPRYATEKRIIQAAKIIDDAYDKIMTSGFADFTCFSNDMVNHPLESKIRTFLLQNFMQGDELLRHWRLDKYLLERLHYTGAKSTLVYFVFGDSWNSIPSPLKNILAELVVEKGGCLKTLKASKDFVNLLQDVLVPHAYALCASWQAFEQHFEDLLLTYKRLRPQILAYQSHPDTIEMCRSNQIKQYFDEEYCDNIIIENNRWVEIIRKTVFDNWASQCDFYTVASWLLQEDWTLLRQYHIRKALLEAG